MDNGSLWDDFERSQTYRAETLGYVRLCLGLPCENCWTEAKAPTKIIRNFDIVGSAIRNTYTTG